MAGPLTQIEESSAYRKQRDARRSALDTATRNVASRGVEGVKSVVIQVQKSVLTGYGPRNSSELYDCVRALFGKNIPHTSCSPHARAPFEWFCNVYFGISKNTVGLASRSSGKTDMGSELHYLWNTFEPNHTSRHAAANREQAKVASSYLRAFSQTDPLNSVFQRDSINTFDARWRNNSHWAVVTGSEAGVSGQHPQKATWDEIEFWKKAAVEQSFFVPVAKDGSEGTWAAFSTRQRSWGTMNWLVDVAPERNIDLFTWTAFETMRRCRTCVAIDNAPYGTDKDRMRHCILWDDCYGKKGVKASGWVPRETVCANKVKLGGSGSSQWRVQGLCDKPSSEGLVLYNFEHEPMPEGNYSPWEYVPEIPWYAMHDPAEGNTSVLYFVQVDDDDNDHIFDELVLEKCFTTNVMKIAFYRHCLEMGYGDPVKIIVDPHKSDAIADWKYGSRFGIEINHRYEAEGPPIDERSGGQLLDKTLDMLRKAIFNGRTRTLFVNPKTAPQCVNAIKEYHYKLDDAGLATEVPHKEYSDHIDPIRYWRMWKRHRYLRSGKTRVHVV